MLIRLGGTNYTHNFPPQIFVKMCYFAIFSAKPDGDRVDLGQVLKLLSNHFARVLFTDMAVLPGGDSLVEGGGLPRRHPG